MSHPSVSVVLPVFNGERFISEALQSIAQQTNPPQEVVVVDDGSTDRSVQLARSFPFARLIEQENAGVAAARNVGIEASTGELIAFLDQDDRWTPDKLEKQVAYLEEHPETGLVLGGLCMFLEAETERPSWVPASRLDKPMPGLMPGAYVVRRSLFEKIGLFDASIETSSDTDWLLRAKASGEALACIADVVLERRVHSANQSSNELCTEELLVIIHQWIKARRSAASQGKET